MVYRIPLEKLDDIKKKIAKVEKKMSECKMRCSLKVSNPYSVSVNIIRACIPYTFDVTVVDVDLDISGWEYLDKYYIVAVLEHFKKDKEVYYSNIVHPFKKDSITADDCKIMSGLKPRCQHCNTNRLRKKTVILCEKDTERLIQVGMSCIDSYLNTDIARLLDKASDIEMFIDNSLKENDLSGYYTLNDNFIDIVWLIATELYIFDIKDLKSEGFISLDRREIACRILGYMRNRTLESKIAQYTSKAKQIVDYVKNDGYRDFSDFENKCVSICNNGIIRNKNIQMAVWIPDVYERKLKRKEMELKKLQLEQERKERAESSEYLGAVGDKISNIWVKCEKCLYSGETQLQNGMQVSFSVFLLIYNNQELIYKKSGGGLLEDCMYLIKSAKIKNIDEYNGIKQTHIFHVRIADSDKDKYYKKKE